MATPKTTSNARSKAVSTRTIAQIAAGIAAIAAGGAVAANFLSGSSAKEAAPITVRELNTKKFEPAEVPHAKADLDGIASRLILVSNSPKVIEPEKTDPSVPPPAPPASIKDHIKFLGVVADGSRLFALIAIDGKQRIVGLGDLIKLAGDVTATVTEITSESATFDDGKKNERIELAHRTGSVVSHAAAPLTNPNAGMNNGKGSQDPRARGMKGGKDPLSGLDPKARALAEAASARAAQAAADLREGRRKLRRQELEKETGRVGEEIERMLDEMEQAGKFGDVSKDVKVKLEKGGK